MLAFIALVQPCWSHTRTPPCIMVPARKRCGVWGQAMLGSRPRLVEEVMVLAEL